MADDAMNEKWVTVATYQLQPHALLARSVLESAGIECWLRDENMARMYAGAHGAVFGGIKLQVRPEDEEAARQLLHRPTIVADPESTDENE